MSNASIIHIKCYGIHISNTLHIRLFSSIIVAFFKVNLLVREMIDHVDFYNRLILPTIQVLRQMWRFFYYQFGLRDDKQNKLWRVEVAFQIGCSYVKLLLSIFTYSIFVHKIPPRRDLCLLLWRKRSRLFDSSAACFRTVFDKAVGRQDVCEIGTIHEWHLLRAKFKVLERRLKSGRCVKQDLIQMTMACGLRCSPLCGSFGNLKSLQFSRLFPSPWKQNIT